MANYHCACGAVYNNESERLECARAHPKPTTLDERAEAYAPDVPHPSASGVIDRPLYRETFKVGARSRDPEVAELERVAGEMYEALCQLLRDSRCSRFEGNKAMLTLAKSTAIHGRKALLSYEALKRHRGER